MAKNSRNNEDEGASLERKIRKNYALDPGTVEELRYIGEQLGASTETETLKAVVRLVKDLLVNEGGKFRPKISYCLERIS